MGLHIFLALLNLALTVNTFRVQFLWRIGRGEIFIEKEGCCWFQMNWSNWKSRTVASNQRILTHFILSFQQSGSIRNEPPLKINYSSFECF